MNEQVVIGEIVAIGGEAVGEDILPQLKVFVFAAIRCADTTFEVVKIPMGSQFGIAYGEWDRVFRTEQDEPEHVVRVNAARILALDRLAYIDCVPLHELDGDDWYRREDVQVRPAVGDTVKIVWTPKRDGDYTYREFTGTITRLTENRRPFNFAFVR